MVCRLELDPRPYFVDYVWIRAYQQRGEESTPPYNFETKILFCASTHWLVKLRNGEDSVFSL